MRDAPVAGEDRQHERQAVAVQARHHPPRLLELGGGHQRLHLDQQRPRALHRREHHPAGSACGIRHEAARRRRAPPPARPRASRTGRPRWSSRSGSSAPAARDRGARARPSNCSTQSTMCSSTRGPASDPSLVTWPTRITAVPCSLATRSSRAATSRTWPTVPGAPPSSPQQRVCTESITQACGRRSWSTSSTRSSPVSASTGTLSALAPRSRALAVAGQALGPQPHLLGRLLAADVQRARDRRAPGGRAACS